MLCEHSFISVNYVCWLYLLLIYVLLLIQVHKYKIKYNKHSLYIIWDLCTNTLQYCLSSFLYYNSGSQQLMHCIQRSVKPTSSVHILPANYNMQWGKIILQPVKSYLGLKSVTPYILMRALSLRYLNARCRRVCIGRSG